MRFHDRTDAGRQLAHLLRLNPRLDPIVVGLARGGVPVAAEIAHALRVPLDICIVRKLVAPGDLMIGGIAETGATYLDEDHIRALGLSQNVVDHEIARELAEIARLVDTYREHPPLVLAGKDVILVDDAAVTTGTIRAAARSIRRRGARTLELAVPVGATQIIDAMRTEFDRVTCLVSDPMLAATGARYDSFLPVSDAEVISYTARPMHS